MIIIGAGMSGLIAAHYFRHRNPYILEAQNDLPNNHQALLRFRTDKVSRVTGVPFKKVLVRKSIQSLGEFHSNCNPKLANQYSRKVTDEVLSRSIWNLDAGERFVAPGDFINRAAKRLDIRFGNRVSSFADIYACSHPVISTMPMPVLMGLAGWKTTPIFKWRPIWSIQAEISDPVVDVYQTIHYPDIAQPQYRASITGKTLIIECSEEPNHIDDIINKVANDFGLWPCELHHTGQAKYQEYGKIVDSDREACRDFMYTMTRDFGIYSLGRFATWRQLLMDDVVDDCAVIERLIQSEGARSGYHQSLATVSTNIPA
jgi:hypothetical protein